MKLGQKIVTEAPRQVPYCGFPGCPREILTGTHGIPHGVTWRPVVHPTGNRGAFHGNPVSREMFILPAGSREYPRESMVSRGILRFPTRKKIIPRVPAGCPAGIASIFPMEIPAGIPTAFPAGIPTATQGHGYLYSRKPTS